MLTFGDPLVDTYGGGDSPPEYGVEAGRIMFPHLQYEDTERVARMLALAEEVVKGAVV